MKRLKIILKSKYFIICLVFLSLFRIYFYKQKGTIFKESDSNFICIVNNIDGNKYLLDCGELLEANLEDKNIKIGDIIKINGYLSKYDNNTNINLFDYKSYQENRNIYYSLRINNYKKINSSNDVILKIKRFIYDRIKNLNSFNYLNAFILGNKKDIDTNSLKKIGIIHLFSISGMHITFLLSFIDKSIQRSKIKNKIIICFLTIYYLIIRSISLLRCIIFFIIKKINYNLDLRFNKYKEIFVGVLLILVVKPNAIYDIGFYYSTILSGGISIINMKLKIDNKILRKIVISTYIFLLSFPLNIYTSFEVNVLSILYNSLFIPFVSFFLFPISLLTFLFPVFDNFLMIVINTFECLVNLFKNINISYVFMKPSIIVMFLYYILLFSIIFKRKILYLLIIILFIHYNYNSIFLSKYVLFLDVGQGDSALVHIDNTNILIDTGGNTNNNISDYITIPLLKSLGIREIDYLIITHGDYDHMGEAINLVNNYKVLKVIFNCGESNDLEQELIQLLDKKEIPYYTCIRELNMDNNKFYFLQTKYYDNENDNSNVIYTEIDGYKFMFMGDAGMDKEKYILNKYNVSDIDVLKVGHHGSKTSSSEDFINEMNPKYSIISVGKKNRYGHPNKEVLNNLKDSKIYRTDEDGSIMFKIKNNKLQIEICR